MKCSCIEILNDLSESSKDLLLSIFLTIDENKLRDIRKFLDVSKIDKFKINGDVEHIINILTI